MTPWRSRGYLDLAAGQSCIKCGAPHCVSAHYSGLMAHKVGKGGAQKAADIVSAHLCDKCHKEFDNYEAGNDDARAVDFLLLCWQTLLRNMEQGVTSIVTYAGQMQIQITPRIERKPPRRRKSRCTAAANQVKRPAGGFA